MPESPWLSAADQRTWRRWLQLNALLPGVLHRELQADAGLSLRRGEGIEEVEATSDTRGHPRASNLQVRFRNEEFDELTA